MLCSLQYRLIWNQCFTFDKLYFAYQGGQYFRYEREDQHDALNTKYATPKPVDPPLTLNFRMRQRACRCCFWQ